MSLDVLGGQSPLPQSLNRYTYVMNDPLNLIDPMGLCPGIIQVDAKGNLTMICTTWGLGDPSGSGFFGGTHQPVIDGGELNNGRGGAASPGLKQKICSAIPQGRVTSLNGTVGLIGGQQGSIQQVVNYNNGEVSNFFTGGVQVGWNGGLAASVSSGFIYKSGGQFANSDFSGSFSNFSGGGPEGPGGSVSWSGGVKIVQGGVGVNLIPGPTGNYSYTWTSSPYPEGNVWTNLPSPLGLFDFAIYGLRKAAGC